VIDPRLCDLHLAGASQPGPNSSASRECRDRRRAQAEQQRRGVHERRGDSEGGWL